MLESIFIATDGRTAKTKSTNVAKKISNASTDINSAKKELNNVDYVDLSYEIDQLESMYKKNNNQASEFETFASTLENMVNDYISVDNECSKRIKSNGKNHRKNTGLVKNLALATICASFDKIGNKLDDIADNVKDWAESVVDWFKTSIKEDWQSYLQFIGGSTQLFISVGTLMGAIAATATGAGVVASIPLLLASLVTMYTGIDKISSSIIDIINVYETDGSTITKEAVDNKLFNFVYEVCDFVAGAATGAGIGKLSDATEATELFTLLGKGDFAAKGLELINNAKKVMDINSTIGDVNDVISLVSDIKGGNIKGILNQSIEFLLNKFLGTPIKNSSGEFASNMIKNNNVAGVLG